MKTPADAQSPSVPVVPNPWEGLRQYTEARIALGRAGHALPTAEVLRFQLSHAQARDAVLKPADFAPLESGLQALGYAVGHLHSRAPDRAAYLKRPDWGRLLDDPSARQLDETPETAKDSDLVLVVGDGLSATAVETHAVPMIAEAGERLTQAGIRVCPVVWLARQARVALSDEVGERLRARSALILIGERPGLSSPDSLGLYLTYGPRRGRQNAERNCISNVRQGGLAYTDAAARLVYLVREALRLGLSGVGLKDLSDHPVLAGSDPGRR
jgi:ethanolamine ammonia-lyase small subunit